MASALPATTFSAALAGRASVAIQAIFAILLGALIIGVAGFSHIEAIHNAAHDTRHSNGFPCH